MSDNGGSTTNQSSNLPLKGFKGNKFEGGQRVPFFVVWGDRFKRDQRFTGLTSSLDIFATVVDALIFRKKGCINRLTASPCCRIFPGKIRQSA
ncbi:MAG: sulfatase-like hydrolase/transferase [Parabacteroides johnsonii]